MPSIEAIATIAAPMIEKPPAKMSATPKKITYRQNNDGSIVLLSLRGITVKELKRMSDHDLKALGLFKGWAGKDGKFFPTDEALDQRYQESRHQNKSKAIATDLSKGMTTSEAFEIAKERGFDGNAKTFRDRFDKSNYGETFGLRRIPHKQGRENWLYFDAKTHS